jgi:cysteine desulfurase / selenocysteine lyase
LNPKTKIVALAHVSNVLGAVNDIEQIAKLIRKKSPDALFVVDGAQAVPHMPVDVQHLDCDFYVFSAHKMLGPTGLGVLYGKYNLLQKLQPLNYGGGMVNKVTHQETTFKDAPAKFEGGTPNIADAIAFSKAIGYLEEIGMENVQSHGKELTEYAMKQMSKVKGIVIYGPNKIENRGAVISFNLADIHPHDLGTILDHEGIAIRGGHHCAQPLMSALDINACSRVSFYIYNTKEDVDALLKGLEKALRLFKR